VLARCTNEGQARWLASQYDVPVPEGDTLTLMGEEPHIVRVRKTPTYWNVESWPVSLLSQSESDVGFP